MAKSSLIKESIADLDNPIESGMFDFFTKGKLLCKIIYEDGTYANYYNKFDTSYIVTINKRSYVAIPECIVRGKENMIVWYFNNPMPINFKFEQSKLNALSLKDKDVQKLLSSDEKYILAKTSMDCEGLFSVFNTKLLQGLYPTGGMTGKMMLVYAAVGLVVVLFFLQITGMVDVVGELSKLMQSAS